MKKPITLLLCLLLFFGMASCSNDSDDRLGGGGDCDDAYSEFVDAASAYVATPNEGNCNRYKAALLSIIDDCNLGDLYDQYGGVELWEEFVAEINAIDCTP